MGPSIILDKSALQSVRKKDVIRISNHYNVIIPPVLVYEILGDLSKDEGKWCSIISNKIWPSSYVTMNYNVLCLSNLFGNEVELKYKPILPGGQKVYNKDGTYGVFFDEPKEMKLFRRWQSKEYTEVDEIVSGYWRNLTTKFDLLDVKNRLTNENPDILKSDDITEIRTHIFKNLFDGNNQDFYFKFLLDEFVISGTDKVCIKDRWKKRKCSMLCDFAPYAFHCLTVQLMFYYCLINEIISTKPTNIVDIEYLYYLPFTNVFVTGDKDQRKLLDALKTNEQFIVDRDIFKGDMEQITDYFEKLPVDEKKEWRYIYGDYPPNILNSVTYEIWNKKFGPWNSSFGDVRPDSERDKKFFEEHKEVFDQIKKFRRG